MGYSTEPIAVVVATTNGGTGREAWAKLRAMVLDGLDSMNSKRSYARSLDNFREWYEEHAGGALLEQGRCGCLRGAAEKAGARHVYGERAIDSRAAPGSGVGG